MHHSSALVWRLLIPILIGIGLLLLAVTRAEGQTSPTNADACLGFSFGVWTPPLDWQAAGHGARPDPKVLQHAPDGRDWAADLSLESADSALVLFPSWWPAGVVVRLPRGLPAPGDTIRGRATALVADGRRQAPAADVRAWRVPCHKDDASAPPTRP
jgi:hypothetical protein